jgi:hypothetical protein
VITEFNLVLTDLDYPGEDLRKTADQWIGTTTWTMGDVIRGWAAHI